MGGVNDLTLLSLEEAAELEPELKCRAALHSPSTAVIDTHALMLAYQGDAESTGAVIALNTRVVSGSVGRDGGVVNFVDKSGEENELEWSILVNAAGLGAREVAESIKGDRLKEIPNISYAKGSFFSLTGRVPFEHIVVPLGATH